MNESTNQPIDKPVVKPWRRYFARVVDYFLFAIILGFLCGLYAPWLLGYSLIIQSMIIIGLWVLVEPVFLSTLGYTPGKFLFNLKVRTKNGTKLSFNEALTRSFRVWVSGLGLGLPFVNIGCSLYEYKKLKDTGTTPWDRNLNLYSYESVGPIRIIFIAVALVAYGAWSYFVILATADPTVLLERMNTELNKDLPKKLDADTVIQKVTVTQETFTYEYQLINLEAKNVNDEIKKSVSNLIRKNFCDPTNLKELRKSPENTSFIYSYVDKNQSPIMRYEMKVGDCERE